MGFVLNGKKYMEQLSFKIKTKRCGKCIRNKKGQWARGNQSAWKGGKILDKSGYIMIHYPNHPYCNAIGYVREHRLIMEKKLGRYLKKEENVHHLDGNIQNNDIKNLCLNSNSQHIKEYHSNRKRNKLGRYV